MHAKIKDVLEQEYKDNYSYCNGEGHSKAMHERYIGIGNCLKGADPAATSPTYHLGLRLAPLSSTEIHRIRRAYWRLLLHSDLFHEPNPRYAIRNESWESSHTYAFISILTVSKLEEIDCVYYHFLLVSKLGLGQTPNTQRTRRS